MQRNVKNVSRWAVCSCLLVSGAWFLRYTFSYFVSLRREYCSFIAHLSVPSSSKDSDSIGTECSVTFASNSVLALCLSALVFFMSCVNKYQHRQSSGPVNLWCLTSLAVWVIFRVFFSALHLFILTGPNVKSKLITLIRCDHWSHLVYGRILVPCSLPFHWEDKWQGASWFSFVISNASNRPNVHVHYSSVVGNIFCHEL